MKSLRYLILLFLPILSFSQNADTSLPLWFKQIRLGVQYHSHYILPIGDGSVDESFINITAMDVDDQISHAVLGFLDIRPFPNLMIKTGIGVGFRSLNATMSETYQFDFGGPPESSFQYRAKLTTFQLPFLFYGSRDWNRARFYGGGGIIVTGRLSKEADVRQVSGATGIGSFYHGDNAAINVSLSGGFIISRSRFMELFIEPTISYNINQFQFSRWKHRFLYFGIGVGANWRVK